MAIRSIIVEWITRRIEARRVRRIEYLNRLCRESGTEWIGPVDNCGWVHWGWRTDSRELGLMQSKDFPHCFQRNLVLNRDGTDFASVSTDIPSKRECRMLSRWLMGEVDTEDAIRRIGQ